MKIEFNSMQYLAKKIVCDLNREGMLTKGYELIGYLSWAIRDELERHCDHYWKAIPNQLSHFKPELCALPMPVEKICVKCGLIYE